MSKSGASTLQRPKIILQDDMQKRRIMKKPTTKMAKWQNRVFHLYPNELVYKSKDGKHERGSISLADVKLCENVVETAFDKQHVFQIGFFEKGKMYHLYLQAKNDEMKEEWKIQIRKLCDHRMQEKYHLGFFKSKNWTCCLKEDKNNIGCQEAYKYQAKDSPLIGQRYSHQFSDESNAIGDKRITPLTLRRQYGAGRTLIPTPETGPSSQSTAYRMEHRRYSINQEPSEEQSAARERNRRPRHSVADVQTYFGKSQHTYLVVHSRPAVPPTTTPLMPERQPSAEEDGKTVQRSISLHLENVEPKRPQRFSESREEPLPNWEYLPVPNSSNLKGPERNATTTRAGSLSSIAGNAGSNHSSRFGSIVSPMEMTRLDSTGSTLSSFTEPSIPRTESEVSDYQKRVDDRDFSVVYTNSPMAGTSLVRGNSELCSTMEFGREEEREVGYDGYEGEDEEEGFSKEEDFDDRAKLMRAPDDADDDTEFDLEILKKLWSEEHAAINRKGSGYYENYKP